MPPRLVEKPDGRPRQQVPGTGFQIIPLSSHLGVPGIHCRGLASAGSTSPGLGPARWIATASRNEMARSGLVRNHDSRPRQQVPGTGSLIFGFSQEAHRPRHSLPGSVRGRVHKARHAHPSDGSTPPAAMRRQEPHRVSKFESRPRQRVPGTEYDYSLSNHLAVPGLHCRGLLAAFSTRCALPQAQCRLSCDDRTLGEPTP